MRAKSDDGFTIVELAVSIGLAGFVFAAVAAVMLGGMRSLAVSKARTQGNEIATQAIEDLQRFGYAQLGLCAEPAAPPSGLTNTVILEGGCAGATVEDSCNNPSGTAISSSYTCARNNITYNVSRYIAWSNPEHTAKRLAVFVNWRDAVGLHTVSQQSSVRAPGVADIVGLKPPTLSNPKLLVTEVALQGGKLQAPVPVEITASGMVNTDQVAVAFSALDPYGQPTSGSVFLTSGDGVLWTGEITAEKEFTFGPGTQFLTFRALRAKDGKQTAAVATDLLKFCETSGCPADSNPLFSPPSVPETVGIHPSGAIKNSFTVSVTTKNVTSADQVSFLFMTADGLRSLGLQIDTSEACTTDSCRWTATVTPTNGYKFTAGPQFLYFTAEQVKSADPLSVDQGNTTAIQSKKVEFG